ncbi:MAG: FAD-dependent oxidoreductase [Desulfobacter sp.]|nr:MAG: FAD-dependent oxidoreductase [Desulfobacter sp.]
MKEICPDILILGGGVAGMSAALALKHQNLGIHLVEKEKDLGGHAASWACLATQTCQNCGACLASEMAAQIKTTPNITLHLNTALVAVNQKKRKTTATLSNGTTLTPVKTLIATGFSPFDPDRISSFHTQTQKNVVTTARLNTLIREEKITTLLGKSPKIAFLQCVGSRNKQENRDYCSQVCCKIWFIRLMRTFYCEGPKVST